MLTFIYNPLLAKCCRCGYEWVTKNKKVKTCSWCRSPYWNKARNSYEYFAMRKWANEKVFQAMSKGFLSKPSNFKCKDCNRQAQEWEHRNYSRPFFIEPVCHRCNTKRGKTKNHYESGQQTKKTKN
jgi:hypothetical protein